MPRKAQDKHVVKRDEIAELSNTKYELEFEDVEKVINKTEDKDKHPENDFLTFKYPFKLCVVGSSNSGKSIMALNLVMKHLNYDTLTICSPTASNQPKFDLLHDLSQLFPDKFAIYEDLSRIRLKKFNRNLTNLIFIDDMQELDEKQQRKMNDIWCRGRHHNVHPIGIFQSYFRIPQRARNSTSHFIFFKINSVREIDRIWRECAADIPQEEFRNIILDCINDTTNPFAFLSIDMFEKEKCLRYRKNLNQLYLVD